MESLSKELTFKRNERANLAPETARPARLNPFNDQAEVVDTSDLESLMQACEVNAKNIKKWARNFLNLRFPQKEMEFKYNETVMFPRHEKRAAPYKNILVGFALAISLLVQRVFVPHSSIVLFGTLEVLFLCSLLTG